VHGRIASRSIGEWERAPKCELCGPVEARCCGPVATEGSDIVRAERANPSKRGALRHSANEVSRQPFAPFRTLKVEMRAQAVVPTTDQVLAERIVGVGDESAFRELYRRHTPRLYQFVLRVMGGDELEAEDVVQDTWIRASRNLAGFRWESKLETWLTGIGLNLCRNRLRSSGRWTDLDEGTLRRVEAPAGEARIDLERAIGLLPAGYRTVLVLHDIEGFKHSEIAERLGVSEGTSKSQLWSARRHMRRLLVSGHHTTGDV